MSPSALLEVNAYVPLRPRSSVATGEPSPRWKGLTAYQALRMCGSSEMGPDEDMADV